MGIWQILERAAADYPDNTAVVDGELRIDYRELHDRCRALAARFVEAGLEPGQRVAHLGVNSLAFLESYFAAAGAALVLVPLNRRLAPRELAEVLADADVRLIRHDDDRLEQAAEACELREGECALLAATDLPDRAPEGFVGAAAGEDDPAHLYYTSGTTGRPKGVVLTHGNVSTHARWAVAELGLFTDDAWGHIAPMFHLADAWATFAVTMVGGRHVMNPRFEPAEVIDLFERERITVTNLIPQMLAQIVRSPTIEGRQFPSLRLMLSGGAPIAPSLVRSVRDAFGCAYAQTYGMTETSPYLTISLLRAPERALPAERQLELISRTGRPFGGVELRVVDRNGAPVAADDRAVGEIQVRGPTVTPGYWNNPEETAAAFVDGWLKTGDLATIDEHGFVNIVDRIKDMIVTGGENVYSTEVEHVLLEHPQVKEAAVFGVPDDHWGELVCAALVPVERDVDLADLAAFCRERLAGYKLPRSYRFAEALPRTASGKISKRTLREEGG